MKLIDIKSITEAAKPKFVFKKIGSYCKGFNDEDAVAFAELDTNWPYGD